MEVRGILDTLALDTFKLTGLRFLVGLAKDALKINNLKKYWRSTPGLKKNLAPSAVQSLCILQLPPVARNLTVSSHGFLGCPLVVFSPWLLHGDGDYPLDELSLLPRQKGFKNLYTLGLH